jgi:membrane associated rhomboid family serine protease
MSDVPAASDSSESCDSVESSDFPESGDSSESRETFGYTRSAVAADLTAIAAVGVVLLAVHVLLPAGTQNHLAFDHSAFAPETLFSSAETFFAFEGSGSFTLHDSQFDNLLTAAYVHAGFEHLLSNLGGYLSLSLITYLVCLQADRRRWFRRTFPLFLVVLPVAVNLTSYAILETRFPGASPVSRGFSGVVAGFGGFLLTAVAVHLRTNYSRETVFFVGQFAVLLLLGELLWIYAERITVLEGGAVAGGLALAISGIVSRAQGASFDDDHYRQVGFDLLYVGLVLALLVWLVYGLFPADPIAHGTFTNVFAHGAGFVEGGLLAVLTLVAFRP